MADVPPSLAYYGSFNGVMQILNHHSLPLFQADEMRDPFLPNKFTDLGFETSDLFEGAVKYMTSAILGRAPPRGNPDHALQKAIRRWRSENRFTDESEIRSSLNGLLPAMVEKAFGEAKARHSEWIEFIDNKRILPFFESVNSPKLWLLEAERYSGAVIKFKCDNGSIFDECVPVLYNKKPPYVVSVKESVDLMVGEVNEISREHDKMLTTQNYEYRLQKEWRLVLERSEDEEVSLKLPESLIQSVYIGASVSEENARQLFASVKKINKDINIYQSVCSATSYEFTFEQVEYPDEESEPESELSQ